MGGTNNPANIVKLTAREHFVCHLLLVKMTLGSNKQKMTFAARCMTRGTKRRERYGVSSITYERLKQQWAMSMKDINKGVPKRQETKDKIRKTLTGYRPSDETRKKLSDSRRGKPHRLDPDVYIRIGQTLKGRKYPNRKRPGRWTDAQRQNILATRTGKKRKCRTCHIEGHYSRTCPTRTHT